MNPWTSNYKSHQGNVGLGRAIDYYASNKGVTVLIPLNDTQKYDLVIERDGSFFRVSVKTTKSKNKNGTSYVVLLKNSGGSSGKSKIRNFDKTTCDIVFVLTFENALYEIPSTDINAHSALTLTSEWDQYKVTLH